MTPQRLWLRVCVPRPRARTRIVMFPHGGGSASFYRPLAKLLPASVEPCIVQYPGREDRLNDPCVHEMTELADAVTAALLPVFDREVVFFGHSMGASVAHEVARRLHARRLRSPALLVTSGRPGPRFQKPGDKHLDDDRLWAEVTRLGGTAPELAASDHLRRLVLPALRADYRLIETYRPPQDGGLQCPVASAAGHCDDEVTADELRGWQDVTSGPFCYRLFPGGHFYLRPEAETVARWLAGLVSAPVPG